MSSVITRGYMRGRMFVILGGFLLVVCAGTAYSYWQAERAKTNVRFGAVVSYMADATNDVIYHALRLDHTRHSPSSAVGIESGEHRRHADHSTAPSHAGERAHVHLVEAIRADLRSALDRLDTAYEALRVAADGDIGMGESQSITAGEEASSGIATESSGNNAILAGIAGLPLPESLWPIWNGSDNGPSMRRDVKEVLTHADRLDIFRDYSVPAAQRVFTELNLLANQKVGPHLTATLNRLNEDMVASYDTLQFTLLLVAASMVLAAILVGLRVFQPMMRDIHQAQEGLQKAKETVEAEKHKAESADRAKSEFLANMSHEIRTPMNGVLGMAELLARTELDSRQNMFVDVIVKSGNALLTIINDILDFSKIDAGQLHLDPAPFLLGEAVEDVATLVSTRVAEKDLEMIVRVDPDLPPGVIGDVGRFRQITTNLVGNAVKFTERGHVLVDVSGKAVDQDTVAITVRVEDTGIGIPEDKLASVFEKFAQVDASSTRRHEGTGLGLAIATRLVEMMGGEMGAESTVGKGSAFWFTVPLPIDKEAADRKPVPIDVSGARILAVDDNLINRQIVSEQLKSWGFDAAAADCGEMALAFLERAAEIGARVDCVILDYQMPGMNGADVARRIRANPATRSIPVILLTSVDQLEPGRLAAECGISAHLTKPARSSALLETIVTALQMANMQGSRASSAAHGLSTPRKDKPHVARVPAAERPAAAPTPRTAGRVEVLVAEDNEVNQLVFSQILNGLDMSYRIATNGRTAVEMYKALKPAIILMDVSMPEMNGLEATRAIREIEKSSGTHIPIIGVTAHALKGDRERCIEAGMDDYLSKPVSPDRLTQKIDTWMSNDEMAMTA
jgi:signal transduction histidine kinase/DNA-binding response OmpR family regulator